MYRVDYELVKPSHLSRYTLTDAYSVEEEVMATKKAAPKKAPTKKTTKTTAKKAPAKKKAPSKKAAPKKTAPKKAAPVTFSLEVSSGGDPVTWSFANEADRDYVLSKLQRRSTTTALASVLRPMRFATADGEKSVTTVKYAQKK